MTKFKPHEFDAVEKAAVDNMAKMAEDLDDFFDRFLENSRETSIAKTKLEECLMWANKSVARNGVK